MFNSIELFSGAGGLALGLAEAGFHHELLVDFDKDAVNTLRHNHDVGQRQIKEWQIVCSDIRDLNFKKYNGSVDLVAGGPPCQPFSLAGKHRGKNDNRDMFPESVRVIRETAPTAFIFENVKGLLRKSFSSYFEYIILQLTYPNIIKKDEKWTDHLDRLEKAHTKGKYSGLKYNVVFRLLNAANFGVPQKRERVFIVGFRSDYNIEWNFPTSTHSEDSLLWSQCVTGEYWKQLNMEKPRRLNGINSIKVKESALLNKYGLFEPEEFPWTTLRQAINDLPDPSRNTFDFLNHEFRAGARKYPGHTGSPIDEPSKTLKAGGHGVPGGENMIRFNDNSVRYLTVREAARVQTFPDDYIFTGSWTECMRQIGNAVPVKLAKAVAESVAKVLTH